MTATDQLAFVVDALDDNMPAAARLAVEARVRDDDQRRSRHAPPAAPCRCRRPWATSTTESVADADGRSGDDGPPNSEGTR